MNIRECYETLGSNYDEVLRRFCGSEDTVKRFALKFLDDGTYDELCSAMEESDGERAFRAAHTLKGIAINLGFDLLFAAASELTEALRAERNTAHGVDGFAAVKDEYAACAAALTALD